MRNKMLEGFLRTQFAEGMALAQASDLVDLIPGPGNPPRHYIARFGCTGLMLAGNDEVREANRFDIGIRFPNDYLRRAEPLEVLTWLWPPHVFHPNVGPPIVCVGRLTPGTGLVDILYQLYEIITYKKVTMREDNALNHAACAWARRNRHRLPVDRRPLKRRALALQVNVTERDPSAREAAES